MPLLAVLWATRPSHFSSYRAGGGMQEPEKTAVGHRKERKQEGGLVAVVGLTQGRNRKQKSRDCGGCGEWTVPLGAP